ncbi:MAG: FHA domain-containing protein [Zetaproteobacteria bacterium]|nr:FHA domain-containing protein [Zetaproteobacteria bacterium]
MVDDFRGVLLVQSGAKQGEKFRLGPSGIILGREKGDLLIPDDQVSSSHCLIQLVASEHVIFDMNSSNGTYVNGKKVVRQSLSNGDTILIGRTIILYENQDLARALKVPSIAEKQYAPVRKFGEEHSERTSVVQTMIAQTIPKEKVWKIILEICYEDGQVETIDTDQQQLCLGRDSGIGRLSSDAGISRRHLVIRVNQSGEVFAKDDGSTNGTLLNGQPMTGLHMVRPTDQIKIGFCDLKIMSRLE